MQEAVFVFDETELAAALCYLFESDEARDVSRQWMEHFPSDERAISERRYYEEQGFWRVDADASTEPMGEGGFPTSQGLSMVFRTMSREERHDFILRSGGSFVLKLVGLGSVDTWDRIRLITGESRASAHHASAWMHLWLADFNSNQDQLEDS